MEMKEFLAIMLLLQHLTYTDSFVLEEVKEEGLFCEIFSADSNITRVVSKGVYLWVWAEFAKDFVLIVDELKKITSARIDTWAIPDICGGYRYNLVVKVQ